MNKQRSNQGLVTFERKDYKPMYIVQAAVEFALHFQTKRAYLKDIFRLIMNSKSWRKETLEIDIENWIKIFPDYESKDIIIELITKWFSMCKDDQDLTDLRGTLVESFVMAYVRKKHKINDNGKNLGWGANVTIHPSTGNDRTVYYTCTTSPKPHVACKNRATVDIGIWDGHHGEFYECKVNPFWIGCSEMKYMDKLNGILMDCGISHDIFFGFLVSHDAATMQIADYDTDFRFQLIGAEELSDILSA